MSRLASRFGRYSSMLDSSTPLTAEQMFKVAPSIFAEGKHESRSDRYTWIPTIEVLNGLKKEGFEPFKVVQSKSRIEGKEEFTKHMIRCRHLNDIGKEEANEVIIINSHDGTSSYQMLSGVFRFVCQNGMISGDTVEDIRVPHKGNIVDNVIECAYTIRDAFDEVNAQKEMMKLTNLSPAEAEIFARASITLKYDEEKLPFRPGTLLEAHRYEDRGEDVWTRMNVIQENLMKGGQSGRSTTGSRITTRPINSIDGNVKLNKALWILADEMAKLKAC